MPQIREPKQERSIEKKQKIVDAGYKLFAEKGYYNTNTAEIAKKANVSTGIVYGYFKDKRDILLNILETYIEKISSPVFSLLDNISSPVKYEEVLPIIIDKTICAHRINSKIHEALHSMTHTDEEVARRFVDLEDKLTLNIEDKLRSLGENIESMREKIHLAICIIQAFSHETIYDEHSYIDYPKMKEIVVKTLIKLFK